MNLGSIFSRRAASWDPSLNRFPDINVQNLAASLRLDKAGERDGAANMPASEARSLTSTELEAIERIRSLRTDALGNFETEMQSFKSRIAQAKSDGFEIRLKVSDAESRLKVLADQEGNHLETERNRVDQIQAKLRDFMTRNGVIGPPRAAANGFRTAALLALMIAGEAALNGMFFAERNAMGVVGGVTMAIMITLVNIFFSMGCGFLSRYTNKRGVFTPLFGVCCVLFWLIFVVTLNLTVAHFRDNLEGNTWDASLLLAIRSLIDAPIGLQSISSWLIFSFGFLIGCASFVKGTLLRDPMPGFNAIWQAEEDAVNAYADAYETAHARIDQGFMEIRAELNDEVLRRRTDLRSAVDALLSRNTVTNNLDQFLASCSSAATRLLKIYREANCRARSTPSPAYFDEDYDFGDYVRPEVETTAISQGMVDAEIATMEEIVRAGVEGLIVAQKRSLSAFPTVTEIKARHALRGEPARREDQSAPAAAEGSV
jgi:predicted membrane protein